MVYAMARSRRHEGLGYKFNVRALPLRISTIVFNNSSSSRFDILTLQQKYFTLSYPCNMPAKSIPFRQLGKGGPRVPALDFGLIGMSFAYGTPPSDEERFKILDRALKLGAAFWDSSEYGQTILILDIEGLTNEGITAASTAITKSC
jgi:hypothetical protein